MVGVYEEFAESDRYNGLMRLKIFLIQVIEIREDKHCEAAKRCCLWSLESQDIGYRILGLEPSYAS
jgi:hypothetical protein